MQKDFFENIFPGKLRNFESLLKERNEGKGFFLGDEVSVITAVLEFAQGDSKLFIRVRLVTFWTRKL